MWFKYYHFFNKNKAVGRLHGTANVQAETLANEQSILGVVFIRVLGSWGLFKSVTQYFCCFARQRAVNKTAMAILCSASRGGVCTHHCNPDPLPTVCCKHFTGVPGAVPAGQVGQDPLENLLPASGTGWAMTGAREQLGQLNWTQTSALVYFYPQPNWYSQAHSLGKHSVRDLQNSPVSSHIYFCTELDPVTRTKLSIRKQITVI